MLSHDTSIVLARARFHDNIVKTSGIPGSSPEQNAVDSAYILDIIITMYQRTEEAMTPEEKQRMIHIRIGDGTHKELRKVAAEYDLTLQEIVAHAVEDRVQAMEAEIMLEEKEKELERRARELELRLSGEIEPLHEEMEQEIRIREVALNKAVDIQVSVLERLDAIGDRIDQVMEEVSRLQKSMDAICRGSAEED
jgi:hypothetical protein